MGEISLPFDSAGSFLDHAITLEFLAQRRYCGERGTPSRVLPESQWRGETVLNKAKGVEERGSEKQISVLEAAHGFRK